MKPKRINKILVTGSQGFLGSHLSEKLLLKTNVIGINRVTENKRYGYFPIKKNIEKLSINEIKEQINGIIHLAAITDVNYCIDNPQKCFFTNVMGTQKILEIARKKDCKFVYISTSHVYGKPEKLPIKEEEPKNPLSIYGASKLAGEICCEGYAKTYGMDLSIVRIFSAYGPKSPSHLVIPQILFQLRKNSIELGNLHPKRDFIYVTDVVNAIDIIFRKTKDLNTYNVGSGKSYSIIEICNILKKIANANIPIRSTKSFSRKNEVDNIISDSSKVKKLGWKPTINIQKGLSLTYNSFYNKIKK